MRAVSNMIAGCSGHPGFPIRTHSPHSVCILAQCAMFSCSEWKAAILDRMACRELWPEYVRWVEERSQGCTPVMLAHNGVGYDMPILENHCHAAGMNIPSHWLWVDSYLLAKWLNKHTKFKCPEGNGLEPLNQHFQLPKEVAHQASGDTMMTVRVFRELLALLPSLSGTSAGAGDTLTRHMANAEDSPAHVWAGSWQSWSAKLKSPSNIVLVPYLLAVICCNGCCD